MQAIVNNKLYELVMICDPATGLPMSGITSQSSITSDGNPAYVGQVLTAVAPTGIAPSGFQWYKGQGSSAVPIALNGNSPTYTRIAGDIAKGTIITVGVISNQFMSIPNVAS